MLASNEAPAGQVSDAELPSGPDWRKSSYSQGQTACVEAATGMPDGEVWVRHSRNPDGEILRFSSAEWQAFVAAVRDGEFGV